MKEQINIIIFIFQHYGMNLKIIFTKQEEDSYNLFINLLSKNEDFILKLSEKF